MKKYLFPSTTQKVPCQTCDKVNEDIRYKTVYRINVMKDRDEAVLSERIKKLNHEWDTERVLEANAASIIFLSSVMGYQKKKCCWFLVTGAVGISLLLHALQGWCPPLPMIRKLGIRTAEEISQEKAALKMLRGDFAENTKDADELLKTAEKN